MAGLVVCGCRPRPQIPGEPALCPHDQRDEVLMLDHYLHAQATHEGSVSLSSTGHLILSGLAREYSHVEENVNSNAATSAFPAKAKVH